MKPTLFGRRAADTGEAETATQNAGLAQLTERLSDVTRPYLVAVVRLHQLKKEHKPPPEVAYQQLRGLLSQTMTRAESLKLPPEDLRDVRYALVAFTDECMQLEAGPLRDFWQSHLLQMEHFNETRAGEGFFERVSALKDEARKAPVLHLHYICLLFGFRGIYGQHGELERENLIDELRQRLDQHAGLLRALPLAPHGQRPDEPGIDRERNRLLQWLAWGCAGMSVLWYLGLLFTVDAQQQHLSDRLRHMYEDLKAGVIAPVE